MREHELVPTFLVVAIDVCILLAILLGYLIKKRRTRRQNHAAARRQDDGATDDVVFGTSPSASARRSHQLARTMPNRRTEVRADNYDGCADNDSFTSEQAFVNNTAMQRLIYSIRKAVTTSTVGLSFAFQDLTRTMGCDKTILEGVTGTIDRGTLFGVMGGSGAGKSTFMNVLMGKLRATAGSIEVNGREDKLSRYKKLYGYVPQDDILHAELTVRENIMHAAKIRLPAKWEQAEVSDHVDAILGCLQLSHVQHSRVGDPRHPLISGGQRKRVNIGIELASAPMALFLDEPTSGNVDELMMSRELLLTVTRTGLTKCSVYHAIVARHQQAGNHNDRDCTSAKRANILLAGSSSSPVTRMHSILRSHRPSAALLRAQRLLVPGEGQRVRYRARYSHGGWRSLCCQHRHIHQCVGSDRSLAERGQS